MRLNKSRRKKDKGTNRVMLMKYECSVLETMKGIVTYINNTRSCTRKEVKATEITIKGTTNRHWTKLGKTSSDGTRCDKSQQDEKRQQGKLIQV